MVSFDYTTASPERMPRCIVNHRDLFEALSVGWFLPPANGGVVMSTSMDVADAADNRRADGSGKYPIPVRVTFDPDEFDTVECRALSSTSKGWETLERGTRMVRDGEHDALAARAVPAWAIAGCEVLSKENAARLAGMAAHVGNLDMREMPVAINPTMLESAQHIEGPIDLRRPEFPKHYNACTGATSMAFAIDAAMGIEERQQGHFPATHPFPGRDAMFGCLPDMDFDNVLWKNAWDVLAEACESPLRPRELLDSIAARCENDSIAARRSHSRDGELSIRASEWRKRAGAVERSEAPLPPEGVGAAVIAAVILPEPERIMAYAKHRPDWVVARADVGGDPTNAVASSPLRLAGRLSGLRAGWSRLPRELRGNKSQWRKSLDGGLALANGIRNELPRSELAKDYSSRGI